MQISLLSFLHRLTKLPNRIYSGDFYKINIILSLLFSIPYVYKISKTHFYWRFCHPTFSFIVGMLFCPHYLLFWMGRGIYFLSYRFGLSVFLSWYVQRYGFGFLLAIFGGLVYPIFFRKGNPCGFFIPSEGQSLCSIHKIFLFWQNDIETIDFSIKMKVRKSGFQNFFRYKGLDKIGKF